MRIGRLKIAAGVTIVVGCGALVGAALAIASLTDNSSSVTAFSNGSTLSASSTADVSNLAASVTRWKNEDSNSGSGTPLASQARDLITNAGPGNDTLSAFPTSTGMVCYEINAAGTCGRVDTSTGISFGMLGGGVGGTRVFGVAADKVVKVQVQVSGTLYDAILNNNGFYFQLPVGTSEHQLQVIATWDDGTTHSVPGPP
ncbi:MAG: hypothetical protein WBQ14_00825 [Gaiellaceae bacterium]